MKLVIYTNIPSHHQIPLGQALADKLPGEFSLVCWEQRSFTHSKLGYRDDYEYDWLIRAWVSENETQKAIELIQSSDTVVWGAVPFLEIYKRIENRKLTFRYAERLFKRGKWRILDPRKLFNIWETCKMSNRNNNHLLSTGPYCAGDFRFIGAFKQRIWRWGYFPAVSNQFKSNTLNDRPVILWAGYMRDWKRVDLLLRAAAWARTHGDGNFLLQIIGYGPEEKNLRLLANQLGLADICEFKSPKSPEKIGEIMEASDIYVLPSNQNEGWGAVVNEAMTHGCCVIGSKSAGSVPWLIQDGVNGRTFEGGSVKNLGQIIRECLDNPAKRQEMGIAAQYTMKNLWSPEEAADRLLKLIEALQRGEPSPFQDDGPCSPA